MSIGAREVLSGFLLVGSLSSVIVLTWVAAWWRPRLRPGVVAAVGLAAGVVAVVAGGLWPDDVGGGGLSSVSSASAVLLVNGIVAVWVSAALLLVTGIVPLARWVLHVGTRRLPTSAAPVRSGWPRRGSTARAGGPRRAANPR